MVKSSLVVVAGSEVQQQSDNTGVVLKNSRRKGLVDRDNPIDIKARYSVRGVVRKQKNRGQKSQIRLPKYLA